MAAQTGEHAKYRWLDAVCSPVGPASTVRHCLMALGRYMEADGSRCFPSTERLAKDTGLGIATVRRNLRQAETLGWIERESCGGGQGWRRYAYRPRIPAKVEQEMPHLPTVKVGSERSHVGGKVGSLSAEGGITECRRWDQSDPLLLQRDARETDTDSSPRKTKTPTPTPDVMAVYEHWVAARARAVNRNGRGPTPKPTPGRLGKVRARLGDGYSVEDLKTAVDGCLGNPFNIEGGFTDLELICRSDAKVEQYLAWAKKHRPPPSPTDQRTGRW